MVLNFTLLYPTTKSGFMRKLIILSNLLLFCFLTHTEAQITNFKLGKISNDDFTQQKCPIDSTAGAYIINTTGEADFLIDDSGVEIYYYYYTKLKIVSNSGLKNAEVSIPYLVSGNINSKVEDIEAISYNYENNILTKTNLTATDCYDQKINESWRVKKFAVPNVKAGTVIEYKYKVRTNYVFEFRDWEFQQDIPVMNSKFTLRMIPFYEYTYMVQGMNKTFKTSNVVSSDKRNYAGINFSDVIYNFEMNNIEAFKDETFITAKSDFISKIDFQLSKINHPSGFKENILSTWPELVKDLMSDDEFGKYVKDAQKYGEKLFKESAILQLNQQQKIDTILNMVKSSYIWDKKIRMYSKTKLKDFIKEKRGNSAEINLFTIGLLNACGINAYPFLISTREHGKIKVDYPFLNAFNNCIILIKNDNGYYLTDATDILLSNNRIPVACINDEGLIVKKDYEWINVLSSGTSRTNTSIRINLKLGNATVRNNSNEYDSWLMRTKYGSDQDLLLNHLKNDGIQLIDSTLRIKNNNNPRIDYIYDYVTEYKPVEINKKMFISPFLNQVPTDNPFKFNDRKYPIDFTYARNRTYTGVFEIPEGYEVSYLPEDKNIESPDFELKYTCKRLSNLVSVTIYYQLKKSVYPADKYLSLKNFFNEISKCGNEKIILEKK